ncbi:Uncharacterized protein dnm_049010 [Desulfonema magnum]|uniref:Uncharacterized protein n=1 Tax=Desulfonema magnum TaxID=45655 RepID=A0A975BPM3_9BACT|nr:Uncharacterized protein dnm_049010 [Desulfonema magnum]
MTNPEKHEWFGFANRSTELTPKPNRAKQRLGLAELGEFSSLLPGD